jgi:acyl-CoA thioesterase-2
MGDLAADTAVKADGKGRYTAELSPDWEIWGPNGGYLAGVALRAAAAASALPRPASISCHFLAVADFGPVELRVEPLRTARRAESLRVTMRQGEAQILEALVWMTAPVEGLVHDAAPAPAVDDAENLPTLAERLGPGKPLPPFRFWDNFEWRPADWRDWHGGDGEWRDEGPLVRHWYRYLPRATFDDPVVDAVRSLILLDTMSWPSARRGHPPGDIGFIAPTLDVNAQFHRAAPASAWLLVEGTAPVAEDGLIGFSSRVWSAERALLASASGHMLCRPTGR